MDRYELELGIVDDLGLDELEMDATIELVQSHVASAAEPHLDTDYLLRFGIERILDGLEALIAQRHAHTASPLEAPT